MKIEEFEKIIQGFDLENLNINKPEILDFISNDDFIKITPYNGFDSSNPASGRQNNYAWAMCDFNGYIYVGTGRNLAASSILFGGQMSPPLDLIPEKMDMGAEIWRYKKDGSLPWERVYKSPTDSTGLSPIIGIRSLIKFNSFNSKPAMYAGAYSMSGIKILKSTNGVDWFEIPTGITKGTSSRNMIVYNNKIYMAVMVDGEDLPSLLYSSSDPELYGWQLETPEGEKGKNPIGVIWAIKVFNNRIYLGTASQEGCMLWRTNGEIPKKDDWTLVIDKGAGDTSNAYAMSLEVFNDYLYVGTAADETSPLTYLIPKGAEIIRVDKDDNWEIVMGGPPLRPSTPSTGERNHPLSNYMNGFNNPYNIYIWQLKVFNGKLYAGTYDTSVIMEPTLELFIKNKEVFSSFMCPQIVELCILFLKLQVKSLSNLQGLFGSDIYVSEDGINFKPVNLNGFNNRYNYGVRNIFISDDNTMYIGTSNPFQGCEVYKYVAEDSNKDKHEDYNSKDKDKSKDDKSKDKDKSKENKSKDKDKHGSKSEHKHKR